MAGLVPTCPAVPLRLAVLVDNTSPSADLLAEHGLAVSIETEQGLVLFDTGATPAVLAANAAALGVNLARVSAVVLSHGHYDHAGGLPAVLAAAPTARVYYHWRCTARRWGRRWWFTKSIGVPPESCRALESAAREPVAGPVLLPEGVILSGPIPGAPAAAQDTFLADSDGGPQPDDFTDEMFLLARTPSGWLLVTGCCHRGVENTLAHARTLTGGEPVHAILGGLHLKGLRPCDLDPVVAALRGAGVREVLCGHCTGEAAQEYLAGHLESRVRPIHVGLRYEA
jgi:7,8-dihydropterin-6-yl-methyl-4-(beta-D-ribofuranosyl)aminobenzene 5'-phosphate synthase